MAETGTSPRHPRPSAVGVRRAVRRVVNVLTLGTPLGLALGLAGGGRASRGPHGLIVVHGYRRAFPGGAAMAVTIGDVVLLRLDDQRLATYPHLLDHEARHAGQYAWCLGPLGFLPAYAAASAWSWWRTRDAAVANLFEVRAGLDDGGYRRRAERATQWRLDRTRRR